MYNAKHLISASFLLVGLSAMAQSNSVVEVGYTSKVIHTDSLALPNNINVGALLRLLPELLERPGEYTLSHYEVQVDGVAMGEAADDVLSIVQLEDVERLEVNESPTSSDLNNGQSGSINICLRSLAKKPQGVSGIASLGVSSDFTLTPNLLLDYRGEKLSVRAMGFGEYFSQQPESWQEGLISRTLNEDERFRQQEVRASLYYRLDNSNDFALTLTEGTSHDRHEYDYEYDSNTSETYEMDMRQRERGVRLSSQLTYNHAFTTSRKLSASAKYSHNPSWMRTLRDDYGEEDGFSKFNNDWQAQLDLSDRLGFAQGRGSLSYKVGLKGSAQNTNVYSFSYYADGEQHTDMHKDLQGLMPLTELTMAYGPLSMKLGAEYNWNSGDEDDDWTGRLSMIWQMNSKNRLRFGFNRQLRYPNILAHESGFDYIGAFHWGRHELTTNVGTRLCRITLSQGKDRYYVGNVMGIYQYNKCFFLSLTGNYYRRSVNGVDGKDGYYTNYNVSLMPSVIFSSGWRVAANVRFFSRVRTEGFHHKSNAILQVNGGKSWGAWSAYAFARTTMRKWDELRNYELATVTYSQMNPATVGFGVSYRY